MQPKQPSKAIIATTLQRNADSADWIIDLLSDWQPYIFMADGTVNDAAMLANQHAHKIPLALNRGREAASYLSYIITHYYHLPEYMVFVHGDRYQTHNDDPIYDTLPLIQKLDLDYVDLEGYVNLRCNWKHCPEPYIVPQPGHDDSIWEAHGDPLGSVRDKFTYIMEFQEIFLISLPQRTDRRDSFAVQARLSNMSFTVVDGVDGTKVPDKALLYTMDITPPKVGAWRAHMNVLQDMVTNNIASALIFEDDADWDVGIRAQMRELARGTRWLGNVTKKDTAPNSPFGDDWDILWVGHCSTKSGRDSRTWVVPHDPTVVPPEHRIYHDKPDMRNWETGPNADNQTRIFFVATYATCMTAYAVSIRGAMKILYHQSLSKSNMPIDTGMGFMCANPPGASDFRCIAPYPTMVGLSRPAGDITRFSDINTGLFDNIQPSEKSRSEGLVFSVHQNIERLVTGQAEFQSQFPENTGETMQFDEILAATGHGEVVDLQVRET
ncbi:glycosyltransferase family 34 protein, partial [Aureobasidium melanogenum]